MAVIKDYVLPCGARIIVHDDCMVPRGSEEEKRAIEAQRMAAYRILVAAARREMDVFVDDTAAAGRDRAM